MPISAVSSLLGFGPRFHSSLVHLLELGYKCRVRMPLFIGAGFVICHLFANHIPQFDLHIVVVGDDEEEGVEYDVIDSSEDDSREYYVDSDGDLELVDLSEPEEESD